MALGDQALLEMSGGVVFGLTGGAALDVCLAFAVLLGIEQAQGRVRDGERWGPRTLDLDLLVYGRSRLEEPGLTVPHPGLPARGFVLYPLREIAPELDVPGMGPVAALCAQCPDDGLIPLD